MWVRPIQGGGPWLLAEWQIAVLGSDGNSDTAASAVDGVDFPVHALAIGIAAFRIARYVLWPFGRTIGRRPGAGAPR